MTKRYMDFVPSKGSKSATTRVVKSKEVAPVASRQVSAVKTVRRENVGHVSGAVSRNVVQQSRVRAVPGGQSASRVTTQKKVVYREMPQKKQQVVRTGTRAGAGAKGSGLSLKEEPQFGVIEDLSPKFVKTEVEKRPLSHTTTQANDSQGKKAAKPKGLARLTGGKNEQKPVEKAVEKSVEKPKSASVTYQTPRTPFINQGKVAKRPLSKNVYSKKVVATEEKSSGPVTIISKPEKDSHASMVIVIIITVMLGALAGTAAFLLLPK